MFKKRFPVLLVLLLFAGIMPFTSTSSAGEYMRVYMNGSQLHFHTGPIIKNNRAFVQMRVIFGEAGIKTEWNNTTKTVTGKKGDTTIKLTIGSKTAYKNGQSIQLDAAPFIYDSYTFVPIRFVSEATDYKVDYHKTFNLIHIHNYNEFIEDRAFKEEQLTNEMMVSLREGKFPDFPTGLREGVGGVLDAAGTPKIFLRETPEEGITHQWMYGDYWFDFGPFDNRFFAIHVKPTRTTITLDEVLDELGSAENIYGSDEKYNYNVYAYYEGIYMYEFLTDPEGKVESISLKRWSIDHREH